MRLVTFATVLAVSAFAVGCVARPVGAPASPAAAPPPGTSSRPPPPGMGPAPNNTYDIGGYAVNKRLFWLGMATVTVLGGVFMDNVPGSASDGELGAMDFVPIGL